MFALPKLYAVVDGFKVRQVMTEGNGNTIEKSNKCTSQRKYGRYGGAITSDADGMRHCHLRIVL